MSVGPVPSPRGAARVARAADRARELCDLLDAADRVVPGDLLGQLLIRLTELANAVKALPQSDRPPASPDPQRPAHDAAWRAVARRLHAALGPDDLYWRENEAGTRCAASLGDDLADIHAELEAGLRMLDLGDVGAAAALWRSGFDERWGRHLDAAHPGLRSIADPPRHPAPGS